MKAQQTITATTFTNSEDNYQNILNRLTANDPSFVHLDLSKLHLTFPQLEEIASKIQNNNFVGNIIWGTYPSSTMSLIENIENKIIQNNKQYQYYPNDFIHGLLSSHVYIDSKDNDKVVFQSHDALQKYNSYLKNWYIHKVFTKIDNGGYYGALYVNDQTKQAVLAHRGTKLELGDLFKNDSSMQAYIKGVFGKHIITQQVTSYAVTKESSKYAQDYDYHLSITGFGLGAWLAELSIYFCYKDFNNLKVKAVTFDSPGSVMQIEELKSNIINHETKFEIENLDIITYLSAPNFVNSCNHHVGKVYRLFPEITKPEVVDQILTKLAWLQKIPLLGAKLKENTFLLDGLLSITGHRLPTLLDSFDSDIGKPIKCEEILDWPTIKYTPNLMKTREEEKSFIKGLLNVIPYSNMVPDFMKSAASSIIYKAIPDNALMGLLNILVELINGNIKSDQYFTTYKYLENSSNKEGYNVKLNLSDRQEFSLSYEGHYRTKPLNLNKEVMATNNRGSSDWYLSQLAKLSIKKIEAKEIPYLLKQQLIAIKEQYTIDPEGKKYLCTKSSNVKTDDVREHIMRLIEISSEVKDILEDKYAHVPKQVINNNELITSNLPTISISNFIYRENVFEEIDKALSVNHQLAISAFAGTGKSSTALEYGYRYQNNKTHHKIVRWFNADTEDKIIESYRNLAIELDLTITAEKPEMVRQLVHNKISSFKTPMLFIFDNVEQYYHIQPYIIGLKNVPNNQVNILITTRNNNLNNDLIYIKLPPFNKTEANSYLKKSLNEKASNQDIELLIKTLGTKEEEILPYTLSKVIAYLKENRLTTIKKYIENIKNTQDEYAEADLLLKILEKTPIAWQLLQYAAHLDPNFISIEIFKELMMLDEEALLEPINKLESLSLAVLTQKGEENGLQLHRLVQEAAIKYVDNYPEVSIETKELQNKLVTTLDNLLPSVTTMPDEKWQVAESLYPHIVKVLNHIFNAQQEQRANLYTKILNSLLPIIINMCDEKGQIAESFYPQIVKVKNNIFNVPEQRASLYTKLGNYSEYVLCKFEQSLQYKEEALKMYQTLYQGNHPNIAMSLNHVGSAYGSLGKVEESLQYLEEALKMRQELYQGNYADIALSLNNVGETYCELGDIQKGLQYLEEALQMLKALYQGNHPNIASSLSNVGAAYCKLGDIQKGLQYKEEALKMRQELYQGNHADIALSLNNVGVTYGSLGKVEESLKYREEALKMLKALYQGNHPNIASSLSNVGEAYCESGAIQKGLQYKEEALKMRQELYQGNHADIALSLSNVGAAYQELGDTKKGLQYLEEALKMRQELYQGNHANIALSLFEIGMYYKELGNTKKGLQYLEEALQMCYALYPGNHLNTAVSLRGIGMAYQESGDIKKGLQYLEEALKMIQALYQGNHPSIALLLNNVGMAYQELGDIKKGLQYHEKALQMYQTLYQENHPKVAISLNNVGMAYHRLDDTKKGLQYQELALKMYQALYQGNHPDIASSLNNVGMAYQRLGDIKKGLQYQELALKMYQALYQGNHPDIASSLNNVNVALKDLKDYEEITSKVKQIIFKELVKVKELSSKGDWSDKKLLYDWGVKGYLEDVYLTKELKDLTSPKTIEIAKMLYFQAMSLGIMSSKNPNVVCAIEFAKNYPELIEKIAFIHPEYFIDEFIVRNCINDPNLLTKIVKTLNPIGQGTYNYEKVSYFHEYSKVAMEKILELRLKVVGVDINKENIKVISSNYVWDGSQGTAERLVKEIISNLTKSKQILIPLNLNHKHWVGISINNADDKVKINYLDSEQNEIPTLLKKTLTEKIAPTYPDDQVILTEKTLELQKSNNCGSEAIENLVFEVTGYRLDQDSTVVVHSLLFEDFLLGANSNLTLS